MKASNELIQLLMKFEGFEEVAYPCSAGVWTYGFGSTRTLAGNKVTQGMSITREEATMLLKRDIAQFAAQVNRLVRVELTQNQFDALVSFTYNLGGGALEGQKDKKTGKTKPSTLLAKLNSKDYAGAAKELDKWIYAGGRKSKGLINRRKAERELFENDIGYEHVTGRYQPDPNNTPLRNRDLPLPTIMQAGLEGSDKRGVQPIDVAVATTSVAGASGAATLVLDPQIITPALSFLQAVDWRVAITVVIVIVCAVLWIRGRR